MPLPQVARCIVHLDMDAFFASVELLRYPQLQGLPVVIGGRSAVRPPPGTTGLDGFARLRDYTGRGVVSTATYAARALGVFSAMGLMKAAQRAPDAILLPVDFPAYRHYAQQFKAAVAQLAPQIEDRGIDEIYIDLSAFGDQAHSVAQSIKDAVFAATQLRCSIGLAPNKLLAKMASELSKPDGLLVLDTSALHQTIWPLAVGKIHGIGPKSAQRLAEMHIHTIGELAHAAPDRLQTAFGLRYARWLLAAAQGQDNRPVVTQAEPKSFSRETTFAQDLHTREDRATLSTIFDHLCAQMAQDLCRKGYAGRTVGIKLRFADFRTVTRDCTLTVAVSDAASIRRAATSCLKRVRLDHRIRLLGVRIGALEPRTQDTPACAATQLSLGVL